MKIRVVVIASIAVLALGDKAKADGFTADRTIAPLAITSGCYLGAHGQGRFTNHRAGMLGATVDGLAQTGVGMGAQIGCDGVYRQFLAGVFADYTWDRSDFTVLSGPMSSRMPWGNEWSAGIRAGFLPTPGTLVYTTLAYVGVPGTSMTNSVGGLPLLTQTFSGPKGIAVGGGVETMLTPTISLKLEYRHVAYDTEQSTGLLPMQVDTRDDVVRAGLTFRAPVGGWFKN